MAYKDEYEVARLHTKSHPREKMKEFYPSINNIYYHLSPPFIGKDPTTGRPKKLAIPSYFIRPLFIFLSAFRKLRGTPFDVLGYRKDRRDERELVSMYVSDIKLIKEKYGVSEKCNLQQLMDLPETVRGFGPIKSESLEIYKLRRKELRSEIHAIN